MATEAQRVIPKSAGSVENLGRPSETARGSQRERKKHSGGAASFKRRSVRLSPAATVLRIPRLDSWGGPSGPNRDLTTRSSQNLRGRSTTFTDLRRPRGGSTKGWGAESERSTRGPLPLSNDVPSARRPSTPKNPHFGGYAVVVGRAQQLTGGLTGSRPSTGEPVTLGVQRRAGARGETFAGLGRPCGGLVARGEDAQSGRHAAWSRPCTAARRGGNWPNPVQGGGRSN